MPTSISSFPATMRDLALKECGHTGVISIPSTLGLIIGPPADSEYAVDPVGVEIRSPSAL